ncbi:hypothetical protein THIX_90499 [Thiomonas sp. X19]|nr:hypothetical protein THIX_60056 [Thiomonas sp. X19]SCC95724.1 hypothetical protein THIX_90499 [Thiomonas sp. X19]
MTLRRVADILVFMWELGLGLRLRAARPLVVRNGPIVPQMTPGSGPWPYYPQPPCRQRVVCGRRSDWVHAECAPNAQETTGVRRCPRRRRDLSCEFGC